MISNTPTPPYYAVIFTSVLSSNDSAYIEMSIKMLEEAKKQKGFIGLESARNEIGITVSYWKDLESIANWKMNLDHQLAQKLGREKWYKSYKTRITQVIRDYEFGS